MRMIAKNKGSTLAIALIIIIVVAVIVIPLTIHAVNERRMSARWNDSVKAFYAAESGVNTAIWSLERYSIGGAQWAAAGWNTSPNLYTLANHIVNDSDGNPVSEYTVFITNPAGLPSPPSVDATGSAPPNDPNAASRSIAVTLTEFQTGLLDDAITARGAVKVGGSGEVVEPDPDSPTDDGIDDFNLTFDFEGVFGRSPEDVKSDSDTQVIVNPENNTPVPLGEERVTWFQMPPGGVVLVSENNWNGSGILIVEGGTLRITGGRFEGIIYVMGGELNLDFSAGNPRYRGCFFTEGETSILGNAAITHDEDAARRYLGRIFNKASWREHY